MKDFFDYIIMDINMPVMNGLEALIQIRKMIENNEMPSFQIIALPANVGTTDISKMLFILKMLAIRSI